MSENNRQWQEDVLRNAATSVHNLARSGLHALKIWRGSKGVVIDAIAITGDGTHTLLGYLWPVETQSIQGGK